MAIKKFMGHSGVSVDDMAVKIEEPVYMTKEDIDSAFLFKGWKKTGGAGSGPRNRIRFNLMPGNTSSSGYKGKKESSWGRLQTS